MKSTLITGAAITAALVVVLFDRIIVPSLVFAFRVIEASFAPEEPATPKALPVSVEPVIDISVPTERSQTKEGTLAPRKARRRKPSAKTLAAIEAIA